MSLASLNAVIYFAWTHLTRLHPFLCCSTSAWCDRSECRPTHRLNLNASRLVPVRSQRVSSSHTRTPSPPRARQCHRPSHCLRAAAASCSNNRSRHARTSTCVDRGSAGRKVSEWATDDTEAPLHSLHVSDSPAHTVVCVLFTLLCSQATSANTSPDPECSSITSIIRSCCSPARHRVRCG
jgi:hypothetical protein